MKIHFKSDKFKFLVLSDQQSKTEWFSVKHYRKMTKKNNETPKAINIEKSEQVQLHTNT